MTRTKIYISSGYDSARYKSDFYDCILSFYNPFNYAIKYELVLPEWSTTRKSRYDNIFSNLFSWTHRKQHNQVISTFDGRSIDIYDYDDLHDVRFFIRYTGSIQVHFALSIIKIS